MPITTAHCSMYIKYFKLQSYFHSNNFPLEQSGFLPVSYTLCGEKADYGKHPAAAVKLIMIYHN